MKSSILFHGGTKDLTSPTAKYRMTSHNDWQNSENKWDYRHTGKCIRQFGDIYVYCRYFKDRKW